MLGVSNIWSNDKGLADLFTLSQNPENVVVLVGMSKSQVLEYSSDKYKEYNLIPIQRTHNQHELAMLYSLADVFVNPTYADMFPTVNLEALACGTPVVTYRTGGSPEAIDEETGVVVPQGDVNALTEAIRRIKALPLSRNVCRQRAEKMFNTNNCFQQYIDLYESQISYDSSQQ